MGLLIRLLAIVPAILMVHDSVALAQDNSPLNNVPGIIAVIGADGNVYLINDGSSTPAAITSDGTSLNPYLLPTWSRNGLLAYFRAMPVNGQVNTQVFIRPGGAEAVSTTLGSLSDEHFAYAYWSPLTCTNEHAGCGPLAILLSKGGEQIVGRLMASNINTHGTSVVFGRADSLYFSWSANGNQMLVHLNGMHLEVVDAATGAVKRILAIVPGFFRAPAWSPVDDRWLLGVKGDQPGTTDLLISAEEPLRVLASDLTDSIGFSWSPDGNSVAYLSENGPLFVIDAVTGDGIAQSAASGVLAFFWSPDSRKIAYLTIASSAPNSLIANHSTAGRVAESVQGQIGVAWNVLDLSTNIARRYGSFVPTTNMIYLVSFFDQFTQSHRLWSPDSRFLVYAETDNELEPIISLLDTSQPDTVPLSIARGTLAIWSFQ